MKNLEGKDLIKLNEDLIIALRSDLNSLIDTYCPSRVFSLLWGSLRYALEEKLFKIKDQIDIDLAERL
jgi:hypothetical protein